MRQWLMILAIVVVGGFTFAQDDDKPAKKEAPKAKKESVEVDLGDDENPLGKKAGDTKELIKKISYLVGVNFAKQVTKEGLELDTEAFLKGLEDSIAGKEPNMDPKEVQALFEAYDPIRRKNAEAKAKVALNKNQKAGDAFLEANKDKEGVKVLPSGLQYKVIASGKGKSPKATDTVKVHYRGKSIEGKVFDQSYVGENPTKKDEPAEFPVNKVIKGWTEALQKMKVGDKWQLVIPAALAYGENGAPPAIGPNAVLVFDVELLEIVE